MKFSVIIPVYNAEKYLAACIDSVLEQHYQNFEILLVNDGSRDASADICERYQSKCPGLIRVFHSENQGALLARDFGIKNASGDVLMFLDADDRLRSDALQTLNEAFAASDCDLILFNGSKEADFSVPFRKYPFPDGTLFFGDSKAGLYRTLVSTSLLNNVCLKAVKRSVISGNTDYCLYSHVRNGEDLLMSAMMLTAADKILLLDRNLYFYRQHGDSVVHSVQPARAASVRTVHLFLEACIDRWEAPELHPIHYAREVRGWIETLMLLDDGAFSNNTIHSMAEEPYFRNAWEKMDRSCLGKKDLFLSGLLYHKSFLALRAIHTIYREIRSVKF